MTNTLLNVIHINLSTFGETLI